MQQAPHRPNKAPMQALEPLFRALTPQRHLITGGTGFIGTALILQLQSHGHHVTLWVRKPTKAQQRFGYGVRCTTSLDELAADDAFDTIINLAGAPVVGPPWTAGRRQQLLDSRVGVTQSLLTWLARTTQKPSTWVQASAIGFYGVRPPEELLDEQSNAGNGFMSELCVKWEAAAAQAAFMGLRQVTLRLGVVLGKGGALPPLLLPIRLGLGGRMGNGRQMFSWVHLRDVLAVIATALQDKRMQGVYNTVAPGVVSQAEFALTAGQVLHRPVWLPLPAWVLRLPMGEMAQLFVDGQRVVPARLQAQGFEFAYPGLLQALQDLS